MDQDPLRRAPAATLALLAASAATLVILLADRPRYSGSITTWPGDDLALATTWLLAITCAAWLAGITLAYIVALARGEHATAHRIAGWAPPIARRVLQTALVGSWALLPTYAYAAAPVAPLTVQVGPAGRLVDVPTPAPRVDVPVVRTPATTAPDRPDVVRPSTAPPKPQPSTRSTSPAARQHVVAAGENLWRISRAEVTRASGDALPANRTVADYWERVIAVNRTTLRSGDPSLIFAGEVVTLPSL
jgi:hypothetical protein